MKQSEIGIGQTFYTEYRFKLVDFLPHMSATAMFAASQKPKEIVSYLTIITPFDKYVWLFMMGCICAQFLLLVQMQHLYSYMTGTKVPKDFIYEGILKYHLLIKQDGNNLMDLQQSCKDGQ